MWKSVIRSTGSFVSGLGTTSTTLVTFMARLPASSEQ